MDFLCFLVFFLFFASQAAAAEPGTCATQNCHDSLQAMLPENHMSVEGENNISACMQCHLPAAETLKDTNAFAVAIHKGHAAENKLECSYCHIIKPDVAFSLPGRKSIGVPDEQTLGALPEITAEWATSPYLGAKHAANKLGCAACHGGVLPVLDEKPTNETCLGCHESYEKLAVKTPGLDHPSRNPHNSHLGPINCTVCHKAHEYSIAYCKDCHVFPMNPIPGGKP